MWPLSGMLALWLIYWELMNVFSRAKKTHQTPPHSVNDSVQIRCYVMLLGSPSALLLVRCLGAVAHTTQHTSRSVVQPGSDWHFGVVVAESHNLTTHSNAQNTPCHLVIIHTLTNILTPCHDGRSSSPSAVRLWRILKIIRQKRGSLCGEYEGAGRE